MVLSYAIITTLINADVIGANELSVLVVARVMRLMRFHRFVYAMKRTEARPRPRWRDGVGGWVGGWVGWVGGWGGGGMGGWVDWRVVSVNRYLVFVGWMGCVGCDGRVRPCSSVPVRARPPLSP